ncbi:hypothetical protein [Nitrogeniibacter aestuarii]|uniref:hypothetical protein n=1 Tax=Nitrogeniibacter aestuarii TaxID=2815343 RepID=UPI001D1103F8|nr:hypothetical protein [Nitrogeniibacter aestuarii]
MKGFSNSEEICNSIVESAERYGPNNPQRLKQLSFVLAKCNPEEVFKGLYSVFLLSEPNNYDSQQLAGVLLFKISPSAEFELEEVLRMSLNTYNLSVEEWPWYLARRFGQERVLNVLERVLQTEKGSTARRSAETMARWVRRYPSNG